MEGGVYSSGRKDENEDRQGGECSEATEGTDVFWWREVAHASHVSIYLSIDSLLTERIGRQIMMNGGRRYKLR